MFNYAGKLSLKKSNLDSEHKVVLHKFGVKNKKKKIFDLKVPLSIILTILEDFNQNITINLPVKGDIDSPNFKLAGVFASVFKDILVNTITSPLKILKMR